MRDILPFVIAGIATGSLYGLAATGLVLTFKTSGVFNFAHGAIGAGAAYLFYDIRDRAGLPAWLAVLVAAGIAAPLVGLILSLLAGRLSNVSTAKRVVATVGVLLTIQGLIELRYGIASINLRTSFPSSTFRVAGVYIGYDQVITAAIAIIGVVGLELLFRRTRLGLQMRAVVDNDELLDLAHHSPAVVRAKAWMIGSVFAAVSGILLAPTVGLDSILLTFVVVQAFGAAAVGRFERTTLTFIAGVGIGIAQSVVVAPRVQETLPFLQDLPGFDSAVPFIVLFAVLLFASKGTFRERQVRRSPRPRSSVPQPVVRGLILVAACTAIAAPTLYSTKVPIFTLGAVFIVIYASLFLLTEVSNQVSLCHVAFVALGATTFSHVTVDSGVPWLVGCAVAGLVVVPVGALVALPAIRLSGLYLALATFGFGILVEKLLYTQGFMFGPYGTRTGQRPAMFGFDGDKGYYFLCLGFAVAALTLVAAIRRARLGRLLAGLAESPTAMTTLGSSTNVTRLLVFLHFGIHGGSCRCAVRRRGRNGQ